jgi:hypothetical protein
MTPLTGIFGGLFAIIISSVTSTRMLITAQSRQIEASELLRVATQPLPMISTSARKIAPRSPAIYISAAEFDRVCTDINHCQLSQIKVLETSGSRT